MDLNAVKMNGTKLQGSNFTSSNLSESQMRNIKMQTATLKGADLHNSSLKGGSFLTELLVDFLVFYLYPYFALSNKDLEKSAARAMRIPWEET